MLFRITAFTWSIDYQGLLLINYLAEKILCLVLEKLFNSWPRVNRHLAFTGSNQPSVER